MKYHVRWEQSAVDDLSGVWLTAEHAARRRITDAAGAIDRRFRHDPYADSESREDQRRIVFVDLLAVEFHVEDQDQLVSVLKIWRIRTRDD